MSKIVFAGDSITAAQYVTEAETFAKLFSDTVGASYVNSGVSGSTASALLTNLQTRVLDNHPSTCVVMIGTNDLAIAYDNDTTLDSLISAYIGTMGSIMDAVKAAGIHLIVLSPPATKITKLWGMQKEFTSALRSLCYAKSVLFIDVFNQMRRDAGSMSASNFSAWWLSSTLDMYHLSATGHRRIADLLIATQLPETPTGTVLTSVLDISFGNIGGGTIKAQIKATGLTVPPNICTKMRLTLQGHVDEPLAIGSLYIGPRAGTDAWDASSLTQVKCSASTSFTVPQGGTLVTDWIPFAWDKTSDLIVSFYGNGDTAHDKLAARSDANGITHYKAGFDDSATANASGFSSFPNYLSLITKIETDGF